MHRRSDSCQLAISAPERGVSTRRELRLSGILGGRFHRRWLEPIVRCSIITAFFYRQCRTPAMLSFRRFALPLFLCVCVGKPTFAQKTAPEEVGMSAERLQIITNEAERRIEEGNLVGMVNLVARRGKVVYLTACGWQNREDKIRMKTDTIFRVASFTKPVTSLAVLALYESGKLQLTDPLSKYIPEFKQMKGRYE